MGSVSIDFHIGILTFVWAPIIVALLLGVLRVKNRKLRIGLLISCIVLFWAAPIVLAAKANWSSHQRMLIFSFCVLMTLGFGYFLADEPGRRLADSEQATPIEEQSQAQETESHK